MGFADAARIGATEAQDIALRWSMTSKDKFKLNDFNGVWNTFNPNKQGGVTVGSLLKTAEDVGVDLTKWKALADAERAAARSAFIERRDPIRPQRNDPRGHVRGRSSGLDERSVCLYPQVGWQ